MGLGNWIDVYKRQDFISMDDLVNPDDEVRIFPPLGGG